MGIRLYSSCGRFVRLVLVFMTDKCTKNVFQNSSRTNNASLRKVTCREFLHSYIFIHSPW